MPMHIPAHKNMDNPAGQFKPKTLGDIIDRVQKQEEAFVRQQKKLTFEEWYDANNKFLNQFQCMSEYGSDVGHIMEVIWKAAQENYNPSGKQVAALFKP